MQAEFCRIQFAVYGFYIVKFAILENFHYLCVFLCITLTHIIKLVTNYNLTTTNLINDLRYEKKSLCRLGYSIIPGYRYGSRVPDAVNGLRLCYIHAQQFACLFHLLV